MYKRPILKREKDYKEHTIEELKENNIPIPYFPPDTEDGKYVFFSIPGMLKMFARKHICNALWLNFADCLELEIGNEKFIRSLDYIESLIKVKSNPRFKQFERIVEIALEKVHLLFKYKSNFIKFMELCEAFGKEYEVFDSSEELDKPLEKYADFYFPLLNMFFDTLDVIY